MLHNFTANKLYGITFIEFLVSMVIFTVAIALSGRLIVSSLSMPFIVTPPEVVIRYIQQATENFNSYVANGIEPSSLSGTSSFPSFNDLQVNNRNLTISNLLSDLQLAEFEVQLSNNKNFTWYIYVYTP